ncbi:MAG: hypothetical protein COS14_08805 [Bacteroidetes bacterium CG02_land_8_20_14_3_00_31_25]|nr:MAG: hypothetical protein COS14_08805 [Bacteroidetes bacterium CG02_land_8_20_14_3_00_31_25]PIX35719.1 MAG: hypothetical protein COZ59_04925 [Bacteroidetes bacterium CG_4_8_14_3_um_filter_31_14]PIY02173.1 MAG: hypothetical protein COZ21_15555 [Bacteroidetes bacterium CG_4_10_14_3_um_filter_31_20]
MRIYVDTSVFGGCFDTEFEHWSNRLIEFFKIGKYKAVISEVSEFELKFAPNHIKQIVTTQPVQRVHKQIFATDYADVTD